MHVIGAGSIFHNSFSLTEIIPHSAESSKFAWFKNESANLGVFVCVRMCEHCVCECELVCGDVDIHVMISAQ